MRIEALEREIVAIRRPDLENNSCVTPIARAASCAALSWSVPELGSQTSATRSMEGRASLSISSHFPAINGRSRNSPVTFPPGRPNARTYPDRMGSVSRSIATMAVVLVACRASGVLPAQRQSAPLLANLTMPEPGRVIGRDHPRLHVEKSSHPQRIPAAAILASAETHSGEAKCQACGCIRSGLSYLVPAPSKMSSSQQQSV